MPDLSHAQMAFACFLVVITLAAALYVERMDLRAENRDLRRSQAFLLDELAELRPETPIAPVHYLFARDEAKRQHPAGGAS